MICVPFFLQILPNLHFYLFHLVNSHCCTVGSASACQARSFGFDPGLERYIFIPVLSGRLVQEYVFLLGRNTKQRFTWGEIGNI